MDGALPGARLRAKADPSCATRINTKGFNDGLLYYDEKYATNGNTQVYVTKRFFTLGQFSRYVRPGAVRHDVTGAPKGVRVMAFQADAQWTIVAWNENKTATTVGLSIPDATAKRKRCNRDIEHATTRADRVARAHEHRNLGDKSRTAINRDVHIRLTRRTRAERVVQ